MYSNIANARWRNALRSRFAGFLGLIAAGAAFLLLWQQIVSWPLHVTYAVPAPGENLETVRIADDYPGTRWFNAMVRVRGDGVALPHFPSRNALADGEVSGFSVKGRAVHLRRVNPVADTHPSATWFIRVPLVMKWSRAARLGTALFAIILVLVLVRNPTVLLAMRLLDSPGLVRACFIVVAASMLFFAVGTRIFGLSFPYWHNDTLTYYDAIAAAASGEAPMATPDRPFAYPLVMGSLLRLIPDLRVIVAAHAASTLFAAVCLAVVFWWMGDRLFISPAARWAGRFAGLFVAGLLAFNEAVMEREWAILGEGWVAIFLGGQLVVAWCLVSTARQWLVSLTLFAIFSLLALLAAFTKPNWGVALALVPLFWVAVVIRNSNSARRGMGWSAIGLATFGALTAAAFTYQAYCTREKPLKSLSYRARALVCWHVPMVRAEIDRRLAADPAETSAPVLTEMAVLIDHELSLSKQTGPGAYPSLGYDADRLFFHGLPNGPLFSSLKLKQQTALCTELFKGALLRRPDMYIAKVAKQMLQFPRRIYSSARISPDEVRGDAMQSLKAAYHSEQISGEVQARYRATMETVLPKLDAPWPSNARLALSEKVEEILRILRRTFTASVLVPAALITLIIAVPRLRRNFDWYRYSPVLLVQAWALGSILLSALTSALTQGLDVERYVELTVPLTLFVQAVCFAITPALIASILQATRAVPSGPVRINYSSTPPPAGETATQARQARVG
jgi:hypothetical protein